MRRKFGEHIGTRLARHSDHIFVHPLAQGTVAILTATVVFPDDVSIRLLRFGAKKRELTSFFIVRTRADIGPVESDDSRRNKGSIRLARIFQNEVARQLCRRRGHDRVV